MPELEMISCHNDFLAPLLEMEAELCQDAFDDRQHDDDWWEERRELYVKMYHISAELEARCANLRPTPLTRPCIELPPARAHEQEEVEWDASCLVGRPPHLRYSLRHWKVMASEARDAGTWPPTELMAELKWADYQISYDYLLESLTYEFQVGDDVEICTGAGWKRGIIVRRNYINAFGRHDYQVLVVDEDCCNSEIDKMCRLLCVKDADGTCLRGHSKKTGPRMTKELCETLIDEVLKLLIQAFWIMEDGYQAFDVECGLLDEMELLEGIKVGLQMMSAKRGILDYSDIDKMIGQLYSGKTSARLVAFQAEECPLCYVPLPVAFGSQQSIFLECCGKRICSACLHESKRAVRQENLRRKSISTNKTAQKEKVLLCAFCRSPGTAGDLVKLKARMEKRMGLGDTFAVAAMGCRYATGKYGISKDPQKAVDLFQHSVNLGSTAGCTSLGNCYLHGTLGIPKDEKKARELLELAANNSSLRFFASSYKSMGDLEMRNGNADLALRYWRVIAAAGHQGAMKCLWKCYHSGQISKAILEGTLRMHQASILEGRSKCRNRYSSWTAAKAGDDKKLKKIYDRYYFGHINAKELEKAIKNHTKE